MGSSSCSPGWNLLTSALATCHFFSFPLRHFEHSYSSVWLTSRNLPPEWIISGFMRFVTESNLINIQNCCSLAFHRLLLSFAYPFLFILVKAPTLFLSHLFLIIGIIYASRHWLIANLLVTPSNDFRNHASMTEMKICTLRV